MASRRQLGITLIELMVAVAIVAILAAIAYPSYQRYVVRTHRNAAQACLSQYAQFMERHYSANLSYLDPVTGSAPVLSLPCRQENSLDRRYTFALRGVTASAYFVDATPIDTQLALDAACNRLSIDQTGARSINGTGTRDQCWR